MKTLLLIFFSLLSLPILAQEVSNVQVRQEGGELIVSFDLSGTMKEYLVEIELAEDGEHFVSFGNFPCRVGPNEIKENLNEPVFIPSAVCRITARDLVAIYFQNMVYVKGGTFKMGSEDREALADEKPAMEVQLSSFFIGKFEVTQELWRYIMGHNPSHFQNCPECPVEQVSWDEVQIFLQKINAATGKFYRLPTEAEWEYAARGGIKRKGFRYSGSNDPSAVGWNNYNSDTSNFGNKPHPVGQQRPNELGLYDMSGNVWEWCNDWYSERYHRTQPDFEVNPQGPPLGEYRVFRGGAWNSTPVSCRVAKRGKLLPMYHDDILGFRLAHPAP
jgi:formylglycine-generating enzyme required for sulfatase activity